MVRIPQLPMKPDERASDGVVNMRRYRAGVVPPSSAEAASTPRVAVWADPLA